LTFIKREKQQRKVYEEIEMHSNMAKQKSKIPVSTILNSFIKKKKQFETHVLGKQFCFQIVHIIVLLFPPTCAVKTMQNIANLSNQPK
jgi:hypothetical protein